ncbi:hypothetical protein HDA40_001153 [Hamadaea flava]|uniref:DUF2690 domain-containing protein n=1 Tax=Hamadaea flava TaxID=1742688 RepID=A0ABV8LPR1_9ACTN|nr:XRE family transcriptional regulator [Hamadaea flava]MCP2322646.1 hypothetical protein [Hamadaea flava]
MGRAERPLDPGSGLLGRFAAELRELRTAAGRPSYRTMAGRVHFSRSALAQAAGGRVLPTLPVLLGYVQACDGDPQAWRTRWAEVRAGLEVTARPVTPERAASPWPYQPPDDGVDPDAAGCGPDAVTAHARKIALVGTRTILGRVELRYSPTFGAAWSRFWGFGPLDHLASERTVEVEVVACRVSDGVAVSFRTEYCYDYHWSDLLRTGAGPVYAQARLYCDGGLVAAGESDRMPLP